MHVTLDARALPVLHDCDVLVVDGSLAGVAAALSLARAGRQVAVVESRTYLGREVTATLRPWVAWPAEGGLPPLVAALVEAAGGQAADGEVPLRMDAVKVRLEDELLGAGIRLLYGSRPVGLCVWDDGLRGAVIANKSGRQVIACRLVIDATATALVCRLAGAEFRAEHAPQTFARTVEFEGVGRVEGRELHVPPELGLAGDRAVVHRGYRGEGHVLLEHHVLLPAPHGDAWELTRAEAQARRATQALVTYLYANVPAFAQPSPGAASYELHGALAPQIAGALPCWLRWVGGEACGPTDAVRAGMELAEEADRHWDAVTARGAAPLASSASARPVPETRAAGVSVREQSAPQPGCPYPKCLVGAAPVPVVRTADVLVVGGGSSGMVAALVAARAGMRTVLVDMNPGLGGTGTYGGIDLFWFPRPIGYTGELYERISAMHERLRLRRPHGIMPSCDIAARLWVLMDLLEDAGVEMLFNSTVLGTIVEGGASGGRVRGVVAATPTGPVALMGKVVVDATGDGDVAAFAGAQCVLGSEREHLVMYALMPESDKPGHYLNVKTSMFDVTNVEDCTRMILAERRRHAGSPHDHGIYLAPRESRHVLGEVMLTFTDQLRMRCWPDVAYVAFSNCDMKGQTTSDWHLMGLQAPNLLIEIPYRALLPRGLEGIIVTGKAFSATHDSIAAPRMQPDLENLGGVAGHAAVMAVRGGTTPRRVDVRALQGELVAAGLLPRSALSRKLVPLRAGDDELRGLIGSLDARQPLYAYSDMVLGTYFEGRLPIVDALCAGPRVTPLLEGALAGAEGARQVLLAQALAAVGSRTGVPVLVEAIERQLAGGQLPVRTGKVKYSGQPPNQCAAPDVCYLLYSLGMARDARALPVWESVVDMLAGTTQEEMVERFVSRYFYVDAVCYGAERLGNPRAVPALRKLHSYAPLRDRQSYAGYEADWFHERMAHLEVVIGRSLARCGSAEGCAILINYLDDVRTVLAEHAHAELARIAGCDLGKDAQAWRQWLAAHGEGLKPAPWTRPTDAVLAWDEDVLTEGRAP